MENRPPRPPKLPQFIVPLAVSLGAFAALSPKAAVGIGVGVAALTALQQWFGRR